MLEIQSSLGRHLYCFPAGRVYVAPDNYPLNLPSKQTGQTYCHNILSDGDLISGKSFFPNQWIFMKSFHLQFQMIPCSKNELEMSNNSSHQADNYLAGITDGGFVVFPPSDTFQIQFSFPCISFNQMHRTTVQNVQSVDQVAKATDAYLFLKICMILFNDLINRRVRQNATHQNLYVEGVEQLYERPGI